MEARIEEIVAENLSIKEFIADRDASECSTVLSGGTWPDSCAAGCRRRVRCLLRDSLVRPTAYNICLVYTTAAVWYI